MSDTVKIDNVVAENGCICIKTVGISMNPFIVMGRDTVFITKNNGRLKKYDSALFKRANGDYVLHRVLKVYDNGYGIVGDNHIKLEFVKEEQIIGVLDGYYKGEKKYVSCNSKGYKFKIRLWNFLPIKLVGVFTLRVCRRIKRFFTKKK